MHINYLQLKQQQSYYFNTLSPCCGYSGVYILCVCVCVILWAGQGTVYNSSLLMLGNGPALPGWLILITCADTKKHTHTKKYMHTNHIYIYIFLYF